MPLGFSNLKESSALGLLSPSVTVMVVTTISAADASSFSGKDAVVVPTAITGQLSLISEIHILITACENGEQEYTVHASI